MKISIDEKDLYLKKNYEVIQENKKTLKVGIDKKFDEIFEDKMWCLFYKMGFTSFSADRQFSYVYNVENNLTKQLDVFCMDDETIIIVECKSAKEFKKGNFKENIESYHAIIPEIKADLRKKFPDKDVAFIYATSNIDISDADKQRLKAFGFVLFNESQVDYFYKLVEHLGFSAKYQFLATVFSKKAVKNMNATVPAIEGNMGGYKYYVFCIEPERLLKICYILHRNYANEDLMPTYQRIIVKKRLTEIRKFVNDGGYFPNSIIISIDAKKPLQFDSAPKSFSENQQTKVGLLHLPKIYQSAYVIDGQHRLYGYSESKYAKTNTIPVVAFVNMEQEKQLEMFMDINEHQKAVSKTLRNTLEVNLLWNSNNQASRRRALVLMMWQILGESKALKSVFYNRIIVGENDANNNRYLTLENLRIATFKTKFLNQYHKNDLTSQGILDFDDNDATRKYMGFLFDTYFKYFKDYVSDEWSAAANGLFNNNMIMALIQLLDDILEEKNKIEHFKYKIDTPENIISKCEDYIFEVCDYLSKISDDDLKQFKSQKGAGGPKAIWQKLRYIIHLKYSEFNPNGLQEYIDNDCQNNNKEASEILVNLKIKLRKLFSQKLTEVYGDKYYMTKAIPEKIQKSLNNLKFEAEKKDIERNIIKNYDYMEFAEYNDLHEISRASSNWSTIFKSYLANTNKLFNGEDILRVLGRFDSSVKQNGNLTKNDFEQLKSFYDEFIIKC